MPRKKEEKLNRVLGKKLSRLNKKELLAHKTPQAMYLQYATYSPPGTIPLFTLLISLEEKLSQESLVE
jgi:hypothetical protein